MGKYKHILTAVLTSITILPLSILPLHAQKIERIRVVGSSTVYPFTTTVAEIYGKTGYKTPVVEATGTGGGMKLFCEGVGLDKPDASNASRRMKPGEFDLCAKNGVKDIIELVIGYDGLSLATAKGAKPLNLTRAQIFLSLAKQVPDASGALINNPYKLWSDIDKSLPARKIEVMGPPPSSGTRDSLHELILEAGAMTLPSMQALKKSNPKLFEATWKQMREDGHYIEAGENDNLIVQKLEADDNLIGVFGFSFLEENTHKIKAVTLEAVEPGFESIANGNYKAAREMYVYFKAQHLPLKLGLKAFMAEYISQRSMGEEGYLEKKGLVPLPLNKFNQMRENIIGLKSVSRETLH